MRKNKVKRTYETQTINLTYAAAVEAISRVIMKTEFKVCAVDLSRQIAESLGFEWEEK